MTDTPEGTGTETYASISDAVQALGKLEDENPAKDTLDNQEKPEALSDEDDTVEAASDDDDVLDDDFSDDEGDAADEEADGPSADPGKYVADDAKVRLDDGAETTVAELRKGSLRLADYTRKQMALAEEKKATEALKSEWGGKEQQVKSIAAQLQQERELITKVAQHYVPKPPDPDLVNPNSDKYDPLAYQTLQVAYNSQMQDLSRLMSIDKASKEKQQKEEEAKATERRANEWKALTEKVPAFRDPKTGQPTEAYQGFWKDAVKAGAQYGLSPQDLQGITDHRYYLLLNDVVTLHRAKARKAEARQKGEGKPPVMPGSKRQNAGDQKQRDHRSAMERLKKTGSIRDAAAALKALEEG